MKKLKISRIKICQNLLCLAIITPLTSKWYIWINVKTIKTLLLSYFVFLRNKPSKKNEQLCLCCCDWLCKINNNLCRLQLCWSGCLSGFRFTELTSHAVTSSRGRSPPVPAVRHRVQGQQAPSSSTPPPPPAQPPGLEFIPYVRTDEVFNLDPLEPAHTPPPRTHTG